MTHTMVRNLLLRIEVAEAHSPPRVIIMAEYMGLRAGRALDLTTCDNDGREWNFDHLAMRSSAVRKLLRDKPTLFIGSLMCTAFSQLNDNVNDKQMGPREVEMRKAYGRKHLEFSEILRYAVECRARFSPRAPGGGKFLERAMHNKNDAEAWGDKGKWRPMSIRIDVHTKWKDIACTQGYWVYDQFGMHS